MTSRLVPAAALFCGALLSARATHAQERWVDDEAVQPRMRGRVGAGIGGAVLTYAGPSDSTLGLFGTGLNAEGAVGLGRGFEIGVRFGLRTDDPGRGLRADEVARGFETATFGTGLSTLANPELRLRWRAVRWRWGEAGIDERVVVPTGSDPNVTEILGVWASSHAPRFARADVGLDGVLSWQSLNTGYVLMPAFGLPIRLWVNVTSGLFLGLVTTTRYYAATRYTTSYLQVTTGLVGGYRIRSCDAMVGTYLIDIVNSGTERSGLGLGLSCRFGKRDKPNW